MDSNAINKITSLMSALSSEADRSSHDPSHIYSLLNSTVNTLSLLLTHIGYLESKLSETEAEVQRLNTIARY